MGVIHTMPVGHILVGDAGGDVEHDDSALAVDVVAIAETTELFLARSVPYVKDDLSKVLIEVSPSDPSSSGRWGRI